MKASDAAAHAMWCLVTNVSTTKGLLRATVQWVAHLKDHANYAGLRLSLVTDDLYLMLLPPEPLDAWHHQQCSDAAPCSVP